MWQGNGTHTKLYATRRKNILCFCIIQATHISSIQLYGKGLLHYILVINSLMNTQKLFLITLLWNDDVPLIAAKNKT
uniref:Uncharacterized protein n=1 Tax=Anguilla anguilla TaxID=7936 RepID=A0A0E9X5K4_ANGAN